MRVARRTPPRDTRFSRVTRDLLGQRNGPFRERPVAGRGASQAGHRALSQVASGTARCRYWTRRGPHQHGSPSPHPPQTSPALCLNRLNEQGPQELAGPGADSGHDQWPEHPGACLLSLGYQCASDGSTSCSCQRPRGRRRPHGLCANTISLGDVSPKNAPRVAGCPLTSMMLNPTSWSSFPSSCSEYRRIE